MSFARSISLRDKTNLRIPKGIKKLQVGNKTIYLRGNKAYYNSFQINDTDAFNPEFWAEESVRTLYEQMIYGAIIHRDFNPLVASMGDTVHTRSIGELDAKRKQNDMDDLEDQDITATDIPVVLNQRPYVSILIGDRERSLAMTELVREYLVPQMEAQARLLDRVIGAHVYQFLDNVGGGLGTLVASNSHDYLLDTRQVLNDNKVGAENRWLGLTSASETFLQKNDLFKSAERIGDGGRALRNALLGRVAGFNTFLELNTPSVRNVATTATTTVSGAQTAGTLSFDVASGAALDIGDYITIAGDNTPLRVTNIATNTITLNRPLRYNVAASAVVTPIDSALVNQASAIAAGQTHGAVATGYPANWIKPIEFDGAATPKIGQLVAFTLSGGTTNDVLPGEYAVVGLPTATSMLLDRPLEANIDNNAIIGLGPAGDYNFALQREAVALVNRPMVIVPEGSGARQSRATYKNMSMRVSIAWDSKKEALRVTVTGLFGIKKLNTNRGAVMLG